MISNSSLKNKEADILKCEENIINILDRAVNLFRRTNLNDLAEKWDKILKTYRSKKK